MNATNLALISGALPTAMADRTTLTAALDIAARVVEHRNTYPILGNVRLRGDGQVMFVTATDLDIVVDIAVPAPADAAFDVTIPAKMLQQLLKGAPKGDFVAFTAPPVKVETLKGEEVTSFDGDVEIDFGKAQYRVAPLHPANFPNPKAPAFSHKFVMAGSALFAGLDAVAFAISNEETRYYLNGIFMHTPQHAKGQFPMLRFVTTDGHRLARQEIETPQGAAGLPGIIIPQKTVGFISRLLKGKTCPESVIVEVGASHVRFSFDNVTITSKVIEGTFPDYERVIPKNNDKLATFAIKPLLDTIEAVSVIASDKGGKSVRLSIDNGNCELSVVNPDAGTARSSLPVDHDFEHGGFERFEIGFNARYLTDILSELKAAGDTVSMAFNDAGSPTIITGAREGWLGVLMPLRV
ncbi:MAG: DNA polymerase III subunit beta [Pseudomonadota bacterium]